MILTVQQGTGPSQDEAGEGNLDLSYSRVPEQGSDLCLPHALHKREAHQHLAAVLSSVCLDPSFLREKVKTVCTGGINNGCMKVSWASLAATTRCCTEIKQEMLGHRLNRYMRIQLMYMSYLALLWSRILTDADSLLFFDAGPDCEGSTLVAFLFWRLITFSGFHF